MAYKVYLGTILFPITPEKIQIKIKNQNKTLNLINEGEVNILKDAGLTEISFTALLPNQQYSFAQYEKGFSGAGGFLVLLEKYKKAKDPTVLNISRVMPDGRISYPTSMLVSLEDYTIEDDVNEGFDVKVSINLKQHREYGTKTVKLSTGSSSKSRSAGTGAGNSGSTYKIVSGDTLWAISKKKLGDGSKWKTIYEANKSVIENEAKRRGMKSSQNGWWIFPGTVLTIP
jgi:hypothetical protein